MSRSETIAALIDAALHNNDVGAMQARIAELRNEIEWWKGHSSQLAVIADRAQREAANWQERCLPAVCCSNEPPEPAVQRRRWWPFSKH